MHNLLLLPTDSTKVGFNSSAISTPATQFRFNSVKKTLKRGTIKFVKWLCDRNIKPPHNIVIFFSSPFAGLKMVVYRIVFPITFDSSVVKGGILMCYNINYISRSMASQIY